MKRFLFIIFLLSSVSYVQGQTPMTKRQKKKIAKKINRGLDKAAEGLEKVDINLNQLDDVLTESLEDLEIGLNDLSDILKQVDFKKLTQAMEKAANELEKDLKTDRIERQMEEVAEKLEKAVDEKAREIEQKRIREY